MEKQNMKAWLYLLPAFLFLGAFMIYPLIDVFVYSFEEGYNSASQTFLRHRHVQLLLCAPRSVLLQTLKNTFILVIITVPVSTGLALLISAALSSIKPLRDLFQTIFFLPYVTNTLAVGLVFMILFKKNSLLRRSDQSTDPVFRRQLRGFHRRTLLGECSCCAFTPSGSLCPLRS